MISPHSTDRTGIPTVYRGVRYRSRLEARWAAFFAALGWSAHYEPFDLNGWIPDFVLHGRRKGHEQIPVEVKPVWGMDDPLFQATVSKIAASGWRGECLVVTYFLPRSGCGELSVGWCDERHEFCWCGACPCDDPSHDARNRWWEPAVFQSTGKFGAEVDYGVGPDNDAAIVGYCHSCGSFTDRISGYYYGGSTGAGDEGLIERLWAEAANDVQWAAL